MEGLTIQQAAAVTGWSPRMLRYVERLGLMLPDRSTGGYRLYGAGQLQRLRTLRELLDRFDVGLSDVGFAARLRADRELRAAVDSWLAATPRRPVEIDHGDWLRWEQDKHQRLLVVAPPPAPGSVATNPAPSTSASSRVPLKETA